MSAQGKRKKSKHSKTGHTPPYKKSSKMAAAYLTSASSDAQVSEVIAEAHGSLYLVTPESSVSDNNSVRYKQANPNEKLTTLNTTHNVETACKQLNTYGMHEQPVVNSDSNILPESDVHAQCMSQPVSHSTPAPLYTANECKQNLASVTSSSPVTTSMPSSQLNQFPIQYPPPPFHPAVNMHALTADMHVMCEKIINIETFIGDRLSKLDLLETLCSKFEHLEKTIYEMRSEIQEIKNTQLKHEHALKDVDENVQVIDHRIQNLESENRYLENENYDLKENFLRFQTQS